MKECDLRQFSNISYAFYDQPDTATIEVEHKHPAHLPLKIEETTLSPLAEDFKKLQVSLQPSIHKRRVIGRHKQALAIVVMLLLGVVVLHIVLFLMSTNQDNATMKNPYATVVKETLETTKLIPDNNDNERRKVSKDIKSITESVRKYSFESRWNSLKQIIKKEKDFFNETIQIDQISLIGERNTGTRWMYEELNRCFNKTSLKVSIYFFDGATLFAFFHF